MQAEIEKLIVKFLNRTISNEEEALLEKWLANPVNEHVFHDYVQVHYAISMDCIDDLRLEQSKDRLILPEIEKVRSLDHNVKPKGFSIKPYLKYAAVLLVVGGGILLLLSKANEMENPVEVVSESEVIIAPGTDRAILTLEDGSQINLENDSIYEADGVKASRAMITYNATKGKISSEVQYNYLTIPRGGQFYVELADGTKVWLNSESQLKYPKNFILGETRKVELVYGEAYFDVSPSTEHQGSRFKVVNEDREIEVLGTKFNVKAYKDDINALTTLEEGLVRLDVDDEEFVIKPGQQVDVNKLTHEASVKYVDVASEVAWKDGVFSFKGKPLKEIMKTLSRWYDVNVVFEDKSLETVRFNGVIRKDKKLEDVLGIMKSRKINTYRIENKTIILN
ncbi:DUF4974 domain-containing protein [Flagellimonas olearia]|uniref:DUF4974 domain-containing protein n=1 Tax=Flagellimonas olearia TaxID=552546 RepID=A0A6I1DYA2_9FLAO|nr:FecR domain-containing protein [Allomuricauda olearia]KAB7530258.1 DUF4974 domain-containing protein [Allomuricauda olearia]